jgi:hypothetical protein
VYAWGVTGVSREPGTGAGWYHGAWVFGRVVETFTAVSFSTFVAQVSAHCSGNPIAQGSTFHRPEGMQMHRVLTSIVLTYMKMRRILPVICLGKSKRRRSLKYPQQQLHP